MFTHLRVVVPGTGHPVGVPYFPGAKNYAYLKVLLPDNEWLSVPGAKGFTHLGVSRLGTRIMLPMLLTRLPVLPCGVGLRTHIRHRFTYGDLRIIFSIGGLESACRSGVCLAVWSLLGGLESACRPGVCLALWSLLADEWGASKSPCLFHYLWGEGKDGDHIRKGHQGEGKIH